MSFSFLLQVYRISFSNYRLDRSKSINLPLWFAIQCFLSLIHCSQQTFGYWRIWTLTALQSMCLSIFISHSKSMNNAQLSHLWKCLSNALLFHLNSNIFWKIHPIIYILLIVSLFASLTLIFGYFFCCFRFESLHSFFLALWAHFWDFYFNF